jgi:DNA-binding transcriptional ArsR family regulator
LPVPGALFRVTLPDTECRTRDTGFRPAPNQSASDINAESASDCMEEGKIVLDRKAFSALAVDSRIRILKALRERRKMLAELSDELGLSASSTKEHMETLLNAGLVERFDDGHKWKYYALTRKGLGIVTPDREMRVWVVLGMSVMGLLISSLMLFNGLSPAANSQALAATTAGTGAAGGVATDAGKEALTAMAAPAAANISAAPPVQLAAESSARASPYLIAGALCALVLILCIIHIAKKRMDERA